MKKEMVKKKKKRKKRQERELIEKKVQWNAMVNIN